jgi:hypothetical protein
MLIRDLFVSDVTRDIPPVVYFHEQSPDKVAAEVAEYIVTGGWPEGHPSHRRVPDGIHEQYVRLLTNMASELAKPGGPELPAAWISGFYGSGKSSFAKLLGLALDGVALPDGTSLSEAWLRRDTTPKADELRRAWHALRQKVDPIAVVFDIGSVARDNEHIHAAAVRQVQRRLGYCSTDPLVAEFELSLERDGEWARFQAAALETLGKPWGEVKDKALAEEDFSLVLSVMYPERYTDPMAWYTSRAGTTARAESPEEAVHAIRDMLKHRKPEATLFIVVDEVSQYVLSHGDRVERLRAFVETLGARLRGKAWLLALGQQQLDNEADANFLVKTKDRFPPRLRVHLAATNIRDVVHKRLLQKTPDAEIKLRQLFDRHRPELKLHAYSCESITPDEFIEVYPLLPGQIDLILQITSALRLRSTRAQGDDQAIRGLLQLLGELFRAQRLAERALGSLITLDQVYEVQHTALDSDVQSSMARVLSACADDGSGLLVRAAKVVALLELIQDTLPTDAKLVAQCLYDRIDLGNNLAAVTEALETLRQRNLLGYSEKHGYKIQSSEAEEWEGERRNTISVPREAISDEVREGLNWLLAQPDLPRLQGRPFPWAGRYSDGRRADDLVLRDPRDEAAITVDFRFLPREDRSESTWVRRSNDAALSDRLVWLAGDTEHVDHLIRELCRSRAMVRKYKPRRDSLNHARKLLLQAEENRIEDDEPRVRDAIAAAWMSGRMFFRGRLIAPAEHGDRFAVALHAAATRLLTELFPHFVATQVQPTELLQLVEQELSGPSPKFIIGELGILQLDGGRYVASCSGIVPKRIQDYVEKEQGVSGTQLLAHFGGPPYGYTANVIKACIAGLLRAGKVRIQVEGGGDISAIRDAGVRDLFEKDRAIRRANIFPAGEDEVGLAARVRIGRFFKDSLGVAVEAQDDDIADAVSNHFPGLSQKLLSVYARLNRLPNSPQGPDALRKLGDALEQCLRSCRQTKPTVRLVKRHLDALRDGAQQVQVLDAELTEEAIAAVKQAHAVQSFHVVQLAEVGLISGDLAAAADRLQAQLASERPWRDLAALQGDLNALRYAFVSERGRLMEWQGVQAAQMRASVKAREGFSTLTADQSNHVLRPLALALTDTTPEAIAPPLLALKDAFLLALQRAEDQANDHLDDILSEGQKPMVTRVDLQLRNREIVTAADVEALIDELRKRLMEQIRSGARVRLL